MLEQLAAAVEDLDLAVDGEELATAFRLRDRLEAKLTLTVAAFDAAELWDTA